MHLIVPETLAEAYKHRGVNLSTGIPGIALYTLGFWFSALFMFLLGIFQGVVFHFCFSVVKYGSYPGGYFATYLFMYTNSIYAGGSLSALASAKYWIAFITVLCALFICVGEYKNKKYDI